jgi:hypothetical protein
MRIYDDFFRIDWDFLGFNGIEHDFRELSWMLTFAAKHMTFFRDALGL